MKIHFVLEGAFQGWGVVSEYNRRGTAYAPTARGVIGLIGCCMGIPRGDSRLKEMENTIRISSVVNKNDDGVAKSGSLLTDFQTVSRIDGKKLESAGDKSAESYSIVLRKSYLNDASFTVYVEGPDEEVKKVYDALLDPVWVPYLGRKNCTPTVPIIPVID